MAQTSPFTSAVVASMRKLYPEVLADKAWDNTGLLLEAPFQSHHPRKANSVLLTIDLTKAVVDEAIQGGHSVVVAYHPVIFRGLKSLTLGDTQQQSLLKLAGHGISVYCPHTAVDAVPGGMADWLCDVITGKLDGPDVQARGSDTGPQAVTNGEPKSSSKQLSRTPAPQKSYSKPNCVPPSSAMFHPDTLDHTRTVITPSPPASIDAANSAHRPGPPPYSAKNTGSGRMIAFEEEQPLGLLISRIAAAVGHPRAFPLAIPQGANIEDMYIGTVGLCPGSGSSVVRAANPPPDLVFTGEVSHHDALAIIERGGAIISLFHSNSERGYLNAVMRPKLEAELKREWKRMQGEPEGKVSVVVSRWDRDPFGIVVLEDQDNIEFESVDEEQEMPKGKSIAPIVESTPAAAPNKAQTTANPSVGKAESTKSPQPEAAKSVNPPAPVTPIPSPAPQKEDAKTETKEVAAKEALTPASQASKEAPTPDKPKQAAPTATAPVVEKGAQKEAQKEMPKAAPEKISKVSSEQTSQKPAVANVSTPVIKSEPPVSKETHDDPPKKASAPETSTATEPPEKDSRPPIASLQATSTVSAKETPKETADATKGAEPPLDEAGKEASAVAKPATAPKDAEKKNESPSAPPPDASKAIPQDTKPQSPAAAPEETPKEAPKEATREAAKTASAIAALTDPSKSTSGVTQGPGVAAPDNEAASNKSSVKAPEMKKESLDKAVPAQVEQKQALPAEEGSVDSASKAVPEVEPAPVSASTDATEASKEQTAKAPTEVKSKDVAAEVAAGKSAEGANEASAHGSATEDEPKQAPTPAAASIAKETATDQAQETSKAPAAASALKDTKETPTEDSAKSEPAVNAPSIHEATKEVREANPNPAAAAAATVPSKPQEPTSAPQSVLPAKSSGAEASIPPPTTAKVSGDTPEVAAPADPPVKADAQAPKSAESQQTASEPAVSPPQSQPPVAKEATPTEAKPTAPIPAAAPQSDSILKSEVQTPSTSAATVAASTADAVKSQPSSVETPAPSTPDAPKVKAPETKPAEAEKAPVPEAPAKPTN